MVRALLLLLLPCVCLALMSKLLLLLLLVPVAQDILPTLRLGGRLQPLCWWVPIGGMQLLHLHVTFISATIKPATNCCTND
jgi:hypothetical protein